MVAGRFGRNEMRCPDRQKQQTYLQDGSIKKLTKSHEPRSDRPGLLHYLLPKLRFLGFALKLTHCLAIPTPATNLSYAFTGHLWAAPRLQTALQASKQGLRVCTSAGHQKRNTRLSELTCLSVSFVSVDKARETSPGNRGLTLLPPRCGTHAHRRQVCKGFTNLQGRRAGGHQLSGRHKWESRPRNCKLPVISEYGELRVEGEVVAGGLTMLPGRQRSHFWEELLHNILPHPLMRVTKGWKHPRQVVGPQESPSLDLGACQQLLHTHFTRVLRILDVI